jgi:hypothetical protein
MRFLASAFAFLFVLCAHAERYVPRLMNSNDRKIALEILGFGSASKILSNPYALGGHEGLDFGVSTEYIPVQDLSSLGDKSTRNRELNFYTLSISKGLFYNVDTTIQFTPAFQKEDVSSYGAQLRWGFYEFPFMPGGLSAVLHGSATNYGSFLDTRTTGTDLVATVVVENVALYFGFGEARSIGTFSGGLVTAGKTESATDNCDPTSCKAGNEDIKENHTVFGINLAFSTFYASFEIDRYFLSTYSAKLGYRF